MCAKPKGFRAGNGGKFIEANGWRLLFHDAVVGQLQRLHAAVRRVEQSSPAHCQGNANVKLFRALSKLIFEVVPTDPSRDEFRQGNTLGEAFRHWRRAKIGRRFRLFFRYDTNSRIIVYAWVNDAETLRQSGGKSDPYTVFAKMLGRGNPPDDWSELVKACSRSWN
jgi:toxin YhaV